jgi:dTMP kinase
MFITFEGIDFCGKSTQVELLEKFLRERGEKVEVLREPGGTEISEKIRKILLDKENHKMFMEAELLLFAASRAQLVREVIIPKLQEGYFILSDRFHDSSVAYQGYGRGIDLDFVSKLQNFAIDSAVPDITFFIDITLEEMKKRKAIFGKGNLDRIERSENEFYEKIRKGYIELSEREERFVRIDGMRTVEEIHEEIVAVVMKNLK